METNWENKICMFLFGLTDSDTSENSIEKLI